MKQKKAALNWLFREFSLIRFPCAQDGVASCDPLHQLIWIDHG